MPNMYVSWHAEVKNSTQIHGAPIKCEVVVLPGMTAVAPPNAEYASVWSDSDAYFSSGSAPNAATDIARTPRPAKTPYEIRPITANTTKIAGAVIS